MIIKTVVIMAFCVIFWACCYISTGTDQKNIKEFRSYPIEVQELA
ncbi:MAG: hypothetical protein ACI4ES_05175 [Roseburia sp.]